MIEAGRHVMGGNQPISKFGDEGYDNKLTAEILIDPGGPLTQWRRAHPNGDTVVWQKDHADTMELLRRFRGGPFIVDQFADMDAYDLHNPIYRCEYEGFTGVMYRVNMRLGNDAPGGNPHAPGRGFSVFSIDTPRQVPRTAIRPTGTLDSMVRGRGFQGVKTYDKELDKHYHIQSEDPEFVKTLVTPEFNQYLRKHQLPRVLSFVFDRGTLSTWNWSRVTDADGSPYLLDYMSMMIDYLVQIMKVSPPELWHD
jgi:hypothetical protein